MQGQHAQVRSLPEDVAAGLLIIEIAKIAKKYGCSQLDQDILDACVELVLDKFGGIGVSEIDQAFELYITGVFGLKNAEMWGGRFNYASFLKILTAYTQYAQKIRNKVEMRLEEIKIWAFDPLKNKAGLANFKIEYQEKKNQIQTYDDIPYYWFGYGIQLGYWPKPVRNKLSESIRKYAQVLAEREIEALKKAKLRRVNFHMRQAIRSKFAHTKDEQIRRRRIAIGKKLYVFAMITGLKQIASS